MSQSGIIGRPRGRPFAKGQSGNPGGRPIKPLTIEVRKLETDIRMLARDRGAEAIDKLAALMRGVVRVEIDRKPVEMLVPPMTSSPPPMPSSIAAMAGLRRGWTFTVVTFAQKSPMVVHLRLSKAALLPWP